MTAIMLFVNTNNPPQLSQQMIAKDLRRYIVSIRLENSNRQIAHDMSDKSIYDEKVKPLFGHAATVRIDGMINLGGAAVNKGSWEVAWVEESVPYRASIQYVVDDFLALVNQENNPDGIKVTDIHILQSKQ